MATGDEAAAAQGLGPAAGDRYETTARQLLQLAANTIHPAPGALAAIRARTENRSAPAATGADHETEIVVTNPTPIPIPSISEPTRRRLETMAADAKKYAEDRHAAAATATSQAHEALRFVAEIRALLAAQDDRPQPYAGRPVTPTPLTHTSIDLPQPASAEQACPGCRQPITVTDGHWRHAAPTQCPADLTTIEIPAAVEPERAP